jgi:hypothetical protein
MEFSCLHRGRQNNGTTNRVIFQMIFYKDNICEYNIPKEIYYNDAELDEYIYINIFFKKITKLWI